MAGQQHGHDFIAELLIAHATAIALLVSGGE
jgi:hypothetical protein